jgi:hypothetical protein
VTYLLLAGASSECFDSQPASRQWLARFQLGAKRDVLAAPSCFACRDEQEIGDPRTPGIRGMA